MYMSADAPPDNTLPIRTIFVGSSLGPDSIPTDSQIRQRLLEPHRKANDKRTKPLDRVRSEHEGNIVLNEQIIDWADCLFDYFALGALSPNEAQRQIDSIHQRLRSLMFNFIATSPKLSDIASALIHPNRPRDIQSLADLAISTLPPEANAFTLYNPSSGRTRLVPSFNDLLSEKLAEAVAHQLTEFIDDRDPARLGNIGRLTKFAVDGRALFSHIARSQHATIYDLVRRMRYLGLTKNLTAEGEGAKLITALVKSVEFGRLTPEDRGRKTQAPKHRLSTGEKPALEAINTEVFDEQGEPLKAIGDPALLTQVRKLTTDPQIHLLKERYQGTTEILDLIDWISQQAIIRHLLPRQPNVPTRAIDLSELKRIKSLKKEDSSDATFQSSNPLSIWIDEKTNRKFVVKQCPDHTLQSDYFGLEMLQLAGVPIYEFYYGTTPQKDQYGNRRVLITGFLEGFKDPSALLSLPEGSPADMIKARLPEKFRSSKFIQQAMLMEILIGEYNSKAHNFMILGDSVQHIDQGGSLTSTASGKFKGFKEEVTIQDIADVLHCYPDWDPNLSEPVNEAYAQVAQVVDGKLVIKDVPTAKRLLNQLKRIPQSKIEEALVQAGYHDGEASLARMRGWIEKINQEFLPKYQAMPPSVRKEQYLRWNSEAIVTFERAIAMGGELSYYKQALRTRRESLERIWEDAIKEAQSLKT